MTIVERSFLKNLNVFIYIRGKHNPQLISYRLVSVNFQEIKNLYYFIPITFIVLIIIKKYSIVYYGN